MAINFEEIPSYEEINLNAVPKTRTVLEELNARQHLLKERTINCGSIRPLYAKTKMPPQRYRYQYFCACPSFKPQYECKHAGNIIIDRDVLTPEEHIVYLAMPKANLAAPRKMPRYFVKRSIVANCTARVLRLAKPDKKQVTDTLNNFNNIISRRHKKSLEKCLENSPHVEYTTIKAALELIREEKRLHKVAKRKERLRCQKLRRKIERKQRRQIKKIIGLLFEEMKEFLLNDQFYYEQTPLGEVILEAIKDLTDKEFHMTNNLRDYQRTLAYNLAAWISKFTNLNINVTENPPPDTHRQTLHDIMAEPKQDLTTFLPLEDYILSKDKSPPIHAQKPRNETEQQAEQEESETDGNCPAQDVSILCSNNQLTDDDALNLQNLVQDIISLHSSSSSDDVYFSAPQSI